MGRANGHKRLEGYVLDDIATILEGLLAVKVLRDLMTTLTGKPYVSQRDADTMNRELQRIEAALMAGRGRRVEDLKELERRNEP